MTKHPILKLILTIWIMAIALLANWEKSYAQASVNNDGTPPHPSAQLEVKSNNKGLLLPRVTDPATAVASPATGLILYNTTTQQPNFFNGSSWQTMGGALLGRFPRGIGFQGTVGSNTNYNWIAPAGVNEIWVEMWAAGDAGSTTDNSTENSDIATVAGGDAGDFASLILPVTPGQSYAIVVGGGGNTTTASGGNTQITINSDVYQVRQSSSGVFLNGLTTNPVQGLLAFVAGSRGQFGYQEFQQSSSTVFRRRIVCGSGGDAYPNQKGGVGQVINYNASTGALIPSNLISLGGRNGTSPGAGGSGSFGSRGSGGAGLLIIHY